MKIEKILIHLVILVGCILVGIFERNIWFSVLLWLGLEFIFSFWGTIINE